MRHAALGGGKRLRPRLVLAVAAAAGATGAALDLALHTACAVELIHCASLVHDDLPCFDDAATRRGRPTVAARFGEAMAILAGDALLARAFDLLSEAPPELAHRALRILRLLGDAVGSRAGLIGGQSLELCEATSGVRAAAPPHEHLARYHAMKTASLFRVAAEAGATAAEAGDIRAWGEVGRCIGLAYQLADDLYDAQRREADKPVGRDAALGRPNAALLHGAGSVSQSLAAMLEEAREWSRAAANDPAGVLAFLDGVEEQIHALCAPG